MNSNTADLLGAVAGMVTTFALVPQVVKTWRTRSAGDLSLGMFVISSVGLALWLAYGVAIGSAPIVVANTITLVLVAIILVFKLRYK